MNLFSRRYRVLIIGMYETFQESLVLRTKATAMENATLGLFAHPREDWQGVSTICTTAGMTDQHMLLQTAPQTAFLP